MLNTGQFIQQICSQHFTVHCIQYTGYQHLPGHCIWYRCNQHSTVHCIQYKWYQHLPGHEWSLAEVLPPTINIMFSHTLKSLHYAIQHCTEVQCFAIHFITVNSTKLHCMVIHCITLHCWYLPLSLCDPSIANSQGGHIVYRFCQLR